MKINKFQLNGINLTIFFLCLMNVQILPLEGAFISIPKVIFMAIFSIISFANMKYCLKIFILASIYYIVAFLCVSANSISLRTSTVIYLGLFVFSFVGYNALLRKYNISLEHMKKVVKNLLFAFIVVLIFQQACALVGFRNQMFTNICGMFENPFKLNSLAIEPSHAARIMAILFLTYIRLDTLDKHYANVKEFYKQNKWLFIGYTYSCLTMGSSTALLVYVITMLYFVRKETLLFVIPIVITLYSVIPLIDWEPLNRGRAVIEAAITGDQDNIQDADGSASVRTAFYFNTIKAFDLTDTNFLFGHGIEHDQVYEVHEYNVESNLIGGIWQYGFISYVFSLVFIYATCCRFFSIENILFFFFLGGGIVNGAYFWGALMLFSTYRYYLNKYNCYDKLRK